MASLLLGAVGAGVGSMFGYASIGWSIGSAIGGQLFGAEGQDIQGPRLNDRNVSTSAYGNTRPLIYGSYRVGGEIIWSTDLVEHAHKEEAGKGGGGGSYTTYTYTVSFGMALCEGPITGVRKVWFNSELVYSVADDASFAELKASNDKAAGFKVYVGSETQTADPTYQTVVGAANAPAYRGTAYIVWKDLDVTKYGGIPAVTVEVVQAGTEGIGSLDTDTFPVTPDTSAAQSAWIGDGIVRVFSGQGDPVASGRFDRYIYDLATNDLIKTDKYFYATPGEDGLVYTASVSPSGNLGITMIADVGSGDNTRWQVVNIGGLVYTALFPVPISFDTSLDNFTNGHDGTQNIRWQQVDGIDAYVWSYKSNSGQVCRFALPLPFGTQMTLEDNITIEVDASRTGTDPVNEQFYWSLDAKNNEFYVKVKDAVTSATAIKRYDADGNFIESKFSGTNEAVPFAVEDGRLWTKQDSTIQVYDWDSEALLYSQFFANGVNIGSLYCTFQVSGNILVIVENGIIYRFKLSLTNDGYSLDQVVEEICNKVGIPDADIDVTELASDVVRGFLVSRQSSARACLEQLSAAYFFDGRESDGVFEFIKRGSAVSATLTDDDVGCYEGSGVVELHEVERTQEEELPKSLTVRYANINADYQTGAQNAIRQSILDGTSVVVDLPLALTDDEGKEICDTTMFSLWENRTKYKHSTWQKFAKIDAADNISINGKTLRVVSRNDGVNGLIELESVNELPEIYTGQVGTGIAGGHVNQSVFIGGPTDYYLLDIPPLRDLDYDANGFYFVADGRLSDWPGAALLRSQDGSTFDVATTASIGSVVGQADTTLGNFLGGNVFDETNVLRVSVSGVLETKTRLQVLNGANVAIIGDEIIQFRDATLISTGVYDLTGLLRGRMGTELEISTHGADERFALIEDNIARFVQIPADDLNTSRLWAVVTIGKTIEYADRTNITYAANNQRPLYPVQIGAGAAGPGSSWTINWRRRSRYRWQWLDGVDVGSDEASNDFEVAILDGSTTIRTISVTGAFTTTYTIAQQLADFGFWKSSISLKIRQIGDVVNSEWSPSVTMTSAYSSLMLLHMDGANNGTVFTDQYGTTVTANGNAKTSTAQTKFGTAAANFDGTGDYLSFTRNLGLSKSTGFTLDCWIYLTGNTTADGNGNRTATIFTIGSGNDFLSLIINGDSSTTGTGFYLEGRTASTLYGLTLNFTISQNVWHHVAFQVSSTSTDCFLDGVKTTGAALGQDIASVAENYIGKSLTTTFERGFLGYIDELRISSGLRYAGTFTPPTSAYTE
jgi:hypothetical protein